MRILMVNKFLYPRGGAETYVLKLGNKLVELGHTVEYFGMYDEKNTAGNSSGCYTRNVDFHSGGWRSITYPVTIIYSFEAKRKIKKVIESFKPDLVHLNNINFQITPAILDVIKLYNIPVVMTAHDYQLICPNHLLYQPDTLTLCEKCTKRLSFDCLKHRCIHGSFVKSVLGMIEAAVYRVRKTYRYIDTIVCPSLFMKSKLDEQPIFRGKTVFLRNFSEDEEQISVVKNDYVLYFGRLYEEKGIRNLVQAIIKLPDIPFMVAGSGPLEPLVKGKKNIRFVGFKTGEELKDLVRKARFSVYPSVWYENCPLSIIESQKLGTPCLMTGIGGMKELAGNGMTIPGTTVEDIRRSIETLYGSKELLGEMQSELTRIVGEYPNLDAYAEELVKIYDRTKNHGRNTGL